MRLRRERSDKKVYAVIKELGASAAYYIAAASDEIYCDKSSLVGSIGIISAGFGFDEAMKELGIERRLYTSGQHKGFLDPFLPIDVEEEVFWEGVLGRLHEHFIADVKFGRGARLSRDDEIFSGYIYDGRRALELGLVDGIGTVRSVAKDQVGIEELVDYSPRITSIERWFNTMAQALISRLANTNLY